MSEHLEYLQAIELSLVIQQQEKEHRKTLEFVQDLSLVTQQQEEKYRKTLEFVQDLSLVTQQQEEEFREFVIKETKRRNDVIIQSYSKHIMGGRCNIIKKIPIKFTVLPTKSMWKKRPDSCFFLALIQLGVTFNNPTYVINKLSDINFTNTKMKKMLISDICNGEMIRSDHVGMIAFAFKINVIIYEEGYMKLKDGTEKSLTELIFITNKNNATYHIKLKKGHYESLICLE